MVRQLKLMKMKRLNLKNYDLSVSGIKTPEFRASGFSG